MKKIKGRAVFFATLITEAIILGIFYLDHLEKINLAYLWLNPIGCGLVMLFASILHSLGVDKGRELNGA